MKHTIKEDEKTKDKEYYFGLNPLLDFLLLLNQVDFPKDNLIQT